MRYSVFVDQSHQEITKRARSTYGYKKQLSVAAEELDELAILCNKYQRYDYHEDAVRDLYSKAIGEVADVLIVLDHIIEVFGLTKEDLQAGVDGKTRRLEVWMNSSKSLQVSTVMREIPKASHSESHKKPDNCDGCLYIDLPGNVGPCLSCENFSRYARPKRCQECVHKGNWHSLIPGGSCYKCVNEKDQFEPIKEG